MAGYRQYCPVSRASEIVADRWTPLIIREMLAGSSRFNEIERGLPGISRSLLVSRLRHLEDREIIEKQPGERDNLPRYVLTEAGRALKDVIVSLGTWGVRWSFGEPKPEELDPVLLVWKIHQRIRFDALPQGRTVVSFELCGKRARRLWLVLKPDEASVCLRPPGFDADLTVIAETSDLYEVWLGRVEYDAAIRARKIVVQGPRALAKALPTWFLWSPLAPIVRAHREPAAQHA